MISIDEKAFIEMHRHLATKYKFRIDSGGELPIFLRSIVKRIVKTSKISGITLPGELCRTDKNVVFLFSYSPTKDFAKRKGNLGLICHEASHSHQFNTWLKIQQYLVLQDARLKAEVISYTEEIQWAMLQFGKSRATSVKNSAITALKNNYSLSSSHAKEAEIKLTEAHGKIMECDGVIPGLEVVPYMLRELKRMEIPIR